MEWTDEAIVLGVRRHGEADAILEAMTHDHGRHLGLVRGGAGSRLRPVLQAGNSIRVNWRARLHEHLGYYLVEALRLRAGALLGASHAVYAIAHLAGLCRVLPERDPHPLLHEVLTHILDDIDDRHHAGQRIALFELLFLADLGFGLDLSECALTGTKQDLIYVSPKSGRAVSREAGEIWRNKLLRLPPFLRQDASGENPSSTDLADGFALTGFFLSRRVFEPRGLTLPDARQSFMLAVMRDQPKSLAASAAIIAESAVPGTRTDE